MVVVLRFFRFALVGVVIAGGVACAADALLLAADDTRAGAPGDDGPLGALLVPRTVRARGDRPLDVDIVVPTYDDVNPATGPFSPVLLVQGGSTAVARYHWLAAHVASRGFVVVAPHHVADLAFFSQGDGLDALRALRRLSTSPGDALADVVAVDAPALAMGHSLGAVVASNAFAGDEGGVTHLAMFAGVPNPGVDVSRDSGRVLSLAGGNDGLIRPDEIADGAEAFQATTTLAVVDGMTHFQWTDDPTAEDLEREGTESELSVEDVRHHALFLVDAMLMDLDGDPLGRTLLDDPSLWPAGVSPLGGAR